MALAGTTLAFQANDQEDVDFFDRLATDIGSNGKLDECEDEGNFEDVFSKLSVNGGQPVSPELPQQESVSSCDESLLGKTQESSVSTSTPFPASGSSPDLTSENEFPQEMCTEHPGCGVEILHRSGDVSVGSVAFDKKQSEDLEVDALNTSRGDGDDQLDNAAGNVDAFVVNEDAEEPTTSQMDRTLQAQEIVAPAPTVQELQWSSFSQAFGNEDGSDDFLSHIDTGPRLVSNEGFKNPSPEQNSLDANSTEQPTDKSLDAQSYDGGSLVHGVLTQSDAGSSLYDYSTVWQTNQGHKFIGENMSNAQVMDENNPGAETNKSGGSQNLTQEIGMCSVGNNDNYESQYPGWYYDYASNEWKQMEGWNYNTGSTNMEATMQSGVGGTTNAVATSNESWNAAPPQSMSSDLSSHNQNLESRSVDAQYHAGYYEDQQQANVGQSTETLYPGWYFDYSSYQWKQIEGWNPEATDRNTHQDMKYHAYDDGDLCATSSSDAKAEKYENKVHGKDVPPELSWHPTEEVPEAVSANEKVNVADYSNSQYPGWYYDYHSQQWQQIPVSNHLINEDSNTKQQEVMQEPNQTSGFPATGQASSSAEPGHGMTRDGYVLGNEPEFNNSSFLTSSYNLIGVNAGNFTQDLQSLDNRSSIQYQGSGNNVSQFLNQHESQVHPVEYTGTHRNQSFLSIHHPAGYDHSRNIYTHTAKGSWPSDGRPSHPLIAFGFGGKLITMKGTSGENLEPLVVHDLSQLVLSPTNNDIKNDGVSYFSTLNRGFLGGPLIGGGMSTKELLKWVDAHVEHPESEGPQNTNSDTLRILWSVLKVACMHYGKLRSVSSSGSIKSQPEDEPEVALGRVLAAAKMQYGHNDQISSHLDALQFVPSIEQLQEITLEMKRSLIDGKRKRALQLAQQGQLWGPALVIALQLGEKVYVETVKQMAQQQFLPGSPLRTLFLLYSGQTAELFSNLNSSVQLPASDSNRKNHSMQDSAGGMLQDWIGNLSIIAANPSKGDEQVITHLGDCLWKDKGEVAAAHTCYLVADANIEQFSESSRLCLIGADHFKWQRTFATPSAIQRTELYEYAKYLGNPQFTLTPFQPYKLLYAHMLVEAGKISEARRYCQALLKMLKNAGRSPEIEFCRQLGTTLDDRLRLHSQGGYTSNAGTAKIVGKLFGTIDSTLHKIIGLPPRQASEPSLNKNPKDWYSSGQRMENKVSPSNTIQSTSSFTKNVKKQMEVPTRSVSEPNLAWNAVNDQKSSSIGSGVANAPVKEQKNNSAGSGYMGRIGSWFGILKPHKTASLGTTNKFYYNNELKRWVEEGNEQNAEELTPPPPPASAAGYNAYNATATLDAKSSSSSSDIPPLPPTSNQFSARGRLHGVRSRYVDTFNKGTATSTKSIQSSILPTAGNRAVPPPTQFFMPAMTESNVHQDIKHPNDLDPTWTEKSLSNGHSTSAPFDGNENTVMASNHGDRNVNVLNPVTDSQKRSVLNDINDQPASIFNSECVKPFFGTTLPSPPVIEPPKPYVGTDSSISLKAEEHTPPPIYSSGQGGSYLDLQEVEL